MQTYITILRGINVNGQKLIKMDKLNALFVSLGFRNVKTYIQSGNIIFQCKNADYHDLERQIQDKIWADFGFEVPVMVKTKDEWISVAENNPFVNNRQEDITNFM